MMQVECSVLEDLDAPLELRRRLSAVQLDRVGPEESREL
jgi:hypothetical protein